MVIPPKHSPRSIELDPSYVSTTGRLNVIQPLGKEKITTEPLILGSNKIIIVQKLLLVGAGTNQRKEES